MASRRPHSVYAKDDQRSQYLSPTHRHTPCTPLPAFQAMPSWPGHARRTHSFQRLPLVCRATPTSLNVHRSGHNHGHGRFSLVIRNATCKQGGDTLLEHAQNPQCRYTARPFTSRDPHASQRAVQGLTTLLGQVRTPCPVPPPPAAGPPLRLDLRHGTARSHPPPAASITAPRAAPFACHAASRQPPAGLLAPPPAP